MLATVRKVSLTRRVSVVDVKRLSLSWKRYKRKWWDVMCCDNWCKKRSFTRKRVEDTMVYGDSKENRPTRKSGRSRQRLWKFTVIHKESWGRIEGRKTSRPRQYWIRWVSPIFLVVNTRDNWVFRDVMSGKMDLKYGPTVDVYLYDVQEVWVILGKHRVETLHNEERYEDSNGGSRIWSQWYFGTLTRVQELESI